MARRHIAGICIEALKRQPRPQAQDPYLILVRVEGWVDEQLQVWGDGQVLSQLQAVEQFGSVLIPQPFCLRSAQSTLIYFL